MDNTFLGLSNVQLNPIKRKMFSLLDMIKDMGGEDIKNNVSIYEAVINGFEEEIKNRIGGSKLLYGYTLIERGDFSFNFIKRDNFIYNGLISPIFTETYKPIVMSYSIDRSKDSIDPIMMFNNILDSFNRNEFNFVNNTLLYPMILELLKLKELDKKYKDIKADINYQETDIYESSMLEKWDLIKNIRRNFSMFMDSYPLHEHIIDFYKINDSLQLGLDIIEDLDSIKNITRFISYVKNNNIEIRSTDYIKLEKLYNDNPNLYDNISFMIELKKISSKINQNNIQNFVNVSSLTMLETINPNLNINANISLLRTAFSEFDYELFANMVQNIINAIPTKIDKLTTIDDSFNFMKMKNYTTNITEDYIRNIIRLRELVSNIDSITQDINSFSSSSYAIQALYKIKLNVELLTDPLLIIYEIKNVIKMGKESNYSMGANALIDNINQLNKLADHPDTYRLFKEIGDNFTNFNNSFNKNSINILEKTNATINDLIKFADKIEYLAESKMHDEAYESVYKLNESVANVQLGIINEFSDLLYKVGGFQGASEIIDNVFYSIKNAINNGANFAVYLNNIKASEFTIPESVALDELKNIRDIAMIQGHVESINSAFNMSDSILNNIRQQYFRLYYIKYNDLYIYMKDKYNITLEKVQNNYELYNPDIIFNGLQKVEIVIKDTNDIIAINKYNSVFDFTIAYNGLFNTNPINFTNIDVNTFKLFDEGLNSLNAKLQRCTDVDLINKSYIFREFSIAILEINDTLKANGFDKITSFNKSYDLNVMYYNTPTIEFSLEKALGTETLEDAKAKIAYIMKVYREQETICTSLLETLDQIEYKNGNILNTLTVMKELGFINKDGSIVSLNMPEEDIDIFRDYISDIIAIQPVFKNTYDLLKDIFNNKTELSQIVSQDVEIINTLYNEGILESNENTYSILAPMFFSKLKMTINNYGDLNDLYIDPYHGNLLDKQYNSLNNYMTQLGKYIGDYTKEIRPLVTNNSTPILSDNTSQSQLELDAIELNANRDLSIPDVATRRYNLKGKNIVFPDEKTVVLNLPNTSKIIQLITSYELDDFIYDDMDDMNLTELLVPDEDGNIPTLEDIGYIEPNKRTPFATGIDLDSRCLGYDKYNKMNICYPTYRIKSRCSGAYLVEYIGWGYFLKKDKSVYEPYINAYRNFISDMLQDIDVRTLFTLLLYVYNNPLTYETFNTDTKEYDTNYLSIYDSLENSELTIDDDPINHYINDVLFNNEDNIYLFDPCLYKTQDKYDPLKQSIDMFKALSNDKIKNYIYTLSDSDINNIVNYISMYFTLQDKYDINVIYDTLSTIYLNIYKTLQYIQDYYINLKQCYSNTSVNVQLQNPIDYLNADTYNTHSYILNYIYLINNNATYNTSNTELQYSNVLNFNYIIDRYNDINKIFDYNTIKVNNNSYYKHTTVLDNNLYNLLHDNTLDINIYSNSLNTMYYDIYKTPYTCNNPNVVYNYIYLDIISDMFNTLYIDSVKVNNVDLLQAFISNTSNGNTQSILSLLPDVYSKLQSSDNTYKTNSILQYNVYKLSYYKALDTIASSNSDDSDSNNTDDSVVNSNVSVSDSVFVVDSKIHFKYEPFVDGFDLNGKESVTLKGSLENSELNQSNNLSKNHSFSSFYSNKLITNGNALGHIYGKYITFFDETSLITNQAQMQSETNIETRNQMLTDIPFNIREKPIYPFLYNNQILCWATHDLNEYIVHSKDSNTDIVKAQNEIIDLTTVTPQHIKYKYLHGNNGELLHETIFNATIYNELNHFCVNRTINKVRLYWKIIEHKFSEAYTYGSYTNQEQMDLITGYIKRVYGYDAYTEEELAVLDYIDQMIGDESKYPVYIRKYTSIIASSIYYHFGEEVYNSNTRLLIDRLNACVTYETRAIIYNDIEGVLNCNKEDYNTKVAVISGISNEEVQMLDMYKISNFAGMVLPSNVGMIYSDALDKGYLVTPDMLHTSDAMRYLYDSTKYIFDYNYSNHVMSHKYNGLTQEENGLYPIRGSYNHISNYYRVNEYIEINGNYHVKVIDYNCNVVAGLHSNCMDIILPSKITEDIVIYCDRMIPISIME